MTTMDGDHSEYEADLLAGSIAASRRVITWRFLGERDAASAAYCARFGVAHAPEPFGNRDNVWAFPLPSPDPPR